MACLTVIVLSSFVGLILPSHYIRTLTLIEGLWLYGGLALFCGFILYDTQRLMANTQLYVSQGSIER
jgi:hypothetical protein